MPWGKLKLKNFLERRPFNLAVTAQLLYFLFFTDEKAEKKICVLPCIHVLRLEIVTLSSINP